MNACLLIILARTRSCVHDGCNPSNCQDPTHRHRSTNPNKPSYGNTLSPDEHNDFVNSFSESCRLDNLAPELHSSQVQQSSMVNPHHNVYGVGPSTTMHSSQSPSIRPIIHYTHGNVLSPTSVSCSNQPTILEKRSDGNMHQKLQRQLSLNPNAFDPRIVRMHNANTLQTKHSHSEQMQPEPTHVMQHSGQHRQVAPSLSGPRSHMTNHWDLHQVCFFL